MIKIENRIARLEDRLRVNRPAETLEEMVEHFWKHSPDTVMGIVATAAAQLRDKNDAALDEVLKEYLKSLEDKYPAAFVDCFMDGLMQAMEEGDASDEGPRDRRPGESAKDYFKYQVKECLLVVGW